MNSNFLFYFENTTIGEDLPHKFSKCVSRVGKEGEREDDDNLWISGNVHNFNVQKTKFER